jgi:hypothetical protein
MLLKTSIQRPPTGGLLFYWCIWKEASPSPCNDARLARIMLCFRSDPAVVPPNQPTSIVRSGTFASPWAFGVRMMQFRSNDTKTSGIAHIGSQPIALAAATLLIITLGVGSIALWRAYTGTSPDLDRINSSRLLQARTAQASEQLMEKAKGLETSQQESIDQLQVVQDQLQTVRRLLAAQQNDTKRLSEQVGGLTGAIDSLRQSFASVQSAEASGPPSARNAPTRPRSYAARSRSAGARHKPAKPRG